MCNNNKNVHEKTYGVVYINNVNMYIFGIVFLNCTFRLFTYFMCGWGGRWHFYEGGSIWGWVSCSPKAMLDLPLVKALMSCKTTGILIMTSGFQILNLINEPLGR